MVCEYKLQPFYGNEFLKIINKLLFYYLNLPQTGKMIRNNKFSILTAAIILILSFTNASSFQEIDFIRIPYLDKIVHFGLYFMLMFVIILEHRKSFPDTRILILISFIPIVFGAFIELGQSGLTTSREGDILDIIFNSAGVVCAILLWLIVKPYRVDKMS